MFNRADHVKKHFLRIHRGIEYDPKLTRRIKGVDYVEREEGHLVTKSPVLPPLFPPNGLAERNQSNFSQRSQESDLNNNNKETLENAMEQYNQEESSNSTTPSLSTSLIIPSSENGRERLQSHSIGELPPTTSMASIIPPLPTPNCIFSSQLMSRLLDVSDLWLKTQLQQPLQGNNIFTGQIDPSSPTSALFPPTFSGVTPLRRVDTEVPSEQTYKQPQPRKPTKLVDLLADRLMTSRTNGANGSCHDNREEDFAKTTPVLMKYLKGTNVHEDVELEKSHGKGKTECDAVDNVSVVSSSSSTVESGISVVQDTRHSVLQDETSEDDEETDFTDSEEDISIINKLQTSPSYQSSLSSPRSSPRRKFSDSGKDNSSTIHYHSPPRTPNVQQRSNLPQTSPNDNSLRSPSIRTPQGVSEAVTSLPPIRSTSIYECDGCGCCFANYPSLHTHRVLLHRMESSSYISSSPKIGDVTPRPASTRFKPYRCVQCGQRTLTQKEMISHVISSHLKGKPLPTKVQVKSRVRTVQATSTASSSSSSSASRRKQSIPRKVTSSLEKGVVPQID